MNLNAPQTSPRKRGVKCVWRNKAMDSPKRVIPTHEEKETHGIVQLGTLSPNSLISEAGLAEMFGKCRDSIKAAVDRRELPPSVRIMGKPMWTVGVIVRHVETMLESEAKKIRKHSC